MLLLVFTWLIKRNPGCTYAELDQTDQALFDALTRQYAAFATKPAQLWTENYRYDKAPLILVRTNRDKGCLWYYIYLINASPYIDTARYQKVAFPGNPYLQDVYTAKSLGSRSLAYWLPSNFTYTSLSNQEILAFKYFPEMFRMPASYFSFPYFSMHEAFHLYAQKGWTYDQEEYINDYPYTPEHFNILKTEYYLYDIALRTTDTAALSAIMKDWLMIRNYRYLRWPQLIHETNSEAMEGTARYLEYRYSDLTDKNLPFLSNKNGQPSTFRIVIDYVTADPSRYHLLCRTLSYDKGAALGFILDRLDSQWKEKINRGQTQYEIIRNHFGVTYTPGGEVLKRLRQQYEQYKE